MLCLLDGLESLQCLHALQIPAAPNLRRNTMITVNDCEAFCDADPSWVHELACRECLTMVPAYARAHEAALCSEIALRSQQMGVTRESSQLRLAA
jgi:hypothetical protein